MFDINCLKFDEKGLIPGVLQTPGGEVLRVELLDREALEKTLKSQVVTLRGGESTGQALLELRTDADQKAVLILVAPGAKSSFEGDRLPQPWLESLETLLKGRRKDASLEGSYTQKLFARGIDRIAKKVVEESGEVIIAAKNYELDPSDHNREEYLGEAADLLFHLQVLLISQDFSIQDIATVLRERHRQRS